ncbi:Protein transport protein Sec31A [Oryzias melastigma]|uniref:Protein transport protein Sec31A n=1 Tax=Oryzias melastigma TaxID=30732 RepID=A0A834BRR8_ORYME|nr:Protein transport protein Sec31A [Oryzias melastigma]
MKLKEINRTAIQSWSPAQHHPIYLATGTSAQQLDASFSTNASLEFFELDLADPTLDMKSCGSFSSTHRYHKLVWGPFGMDSQGHPSGVLIAGGENGNVILYDPARIMAGESDVVITESDRHSGPVRALDVNPFQANLVASGGNESEIFIWDMNNFGSPMTPGPKTQPLEDISCVAWNRQVQHILASASPSGRASVWDLRKNDLIIKVSDHSNRVGVAVLRSPAAPRPASHARLFADALLRPGLEPGGGHAAGSGVGGRPDARHPDVGPSLRHLSTEDFRESHTGDPGHLLEPGRPRAAAELREGQPDPLLEPQHRRRFCTSSPPAASGASTSSGAPETPRCWRPPGCDGHIDIFSIMGGSSRAQSQRHADQISNSFGNMDPFGTGQALPPLQLPQSSAPPASAIPLKKPPKWICRPVGASFAFGGKLVSLDNAKPQVQPQQQPASHVVHISQVVTETALLDRSEQLQATLSSGNFVGFCQEKIDGAENQFERTLWSFLKVNFESDVRSKYLELLGYNREELASKISAALAEKPADAPQPEPSAPAPLQPPADVPPADAPEAAFDWIAAANSQPAITLSPTPESEEPEEPAADGQEEDLEEEEEAEEKEEEEEEEEIPLNEDVVAPAEEISPVETPAEIPTPAPTPAGVALSISQDVDGLITQALLTGDFEAAVELCLHDNRMADSIILAIAGGSELLEKTQRKYFTKTRSRISKLISAVVMKDWHDILKTCDLQNWKEALAAVMTYAQPEEFSSLCDLLGGRLEAAEDAQLKSQACLCYICAGNVEKLVSCWSRAQGGRSPLCLQDLVEKVVVLRQAVEQTRRSGPAAIGVLLAEKMSLYANLLASQGSLATAISYLPDNTDQVSVQQLRDRLSRALGQQAAAAPARPQGAPSHHPQPSPAPFVPAHQPTWSLRPSNTTTNP